MAVRLTSWPLDFRFLSSNLGSDSPFLIGKDRYDRDKLYAVKRFIDNLQNSSNRPPAKRRTHAFSGAIGRTDLIDAPSCLYECPLSSNTKKIFEKKIRTNQRGQRSITINEKEYRYFSHFLRRIFVSYTSFRLQINWY